MSRDSDPLDQQGAALVVEELVARGAIRDPVELLRSGSNHVFRAGDVVVRVSDPSRDVAGQMLLAEQLAAAGVPVLLPLADLGDIGGARVSLWEYIEPAPATQLDFAGLGRAVARLHTIPPAQLTGVVALPWYAEASWLQLEENLERVAHTAVLADDELATLRRVCEELGGWDRLDPGHPVVVCHGC